MREPERTRPRRDPELVGPEPRGRARGVRPIGRGPGSARGRGGARADRGRAPGAVWRSKDGATRSRDRVASGGALTDARTRDGRGRRPAGREQPHVEQVAQVLTGDLLGQRDERVGGARAERVLLGPQVQGRPERVVADLVAERLQGHRAPDVDRRRRTGRSTPGRRSRPPRRSSRPGSHSRRSPRRSPAGSPKPSCSPHSHSAYVAKPSLSQMSCHWSIVRLLPNHWWASSCTMTESPPHGKKYARVDGSRLRLEGKRELPRIGDDRPHRPEGVRPELALEERRGSPVRVAARP